MSQREEFSENEPECTPELSAANRALFLDKVRQSNAACQAGDFSTAVTLYTDALTLDPANHILFSNRSAARLKQGQFSLALQDATKARELCPQWPKAYFRQGVALQCLGRYGEALASFSAGLGQDPHNKQLLAGLIEATIKSPLRHALEPTFQQLRAMQLDQSPFVVISVVGQELLQAGQSHAAVTVLEAALRIGSCSLKLRGSVFSALSSAHWALNQLDKAIGYMQQDLAVAKSLGDIGGECRAHGNLGSAYFSQGSFAEALTAHRYQLVLAMRCSDTQAAAAALTSLGHVYTATGDLPNALASHKQCVQLVKQMGGRLQEAREIGNVGAVYLAMGEFDSAVDCHTQHLRLARKLNHLVEEARAYSNLGSSHHYRRNFAQAIQYHEQVLRIARQLGDRTIEARAYAGLGHAARCAGDLQQAKRWHEKQLEMALATRDKLGEGRACSNLGIVYLAMGEHDAALKLHQAHLTISGQLQDRAGMGRAYGNIGNAYSAAGLYEAAIKYHKQELTISTEVHDRSAEAATHGNLAVAYQALGAHEMALQHYRAHLQIARELKDAAGESCALLNTGNCLSSRQEFAQAVPYYEQYLMLSQELGDVRAEGKACHFLGYAHYCIGNHREAVRYYDQDLTLAKDLQDKWNMGRAYCNLGLAHLALGNSAAALECQKYFLAIAHMTDHLAGKFRALGNIGDVLVRAGDIEEAARMYHRQLALARSGNERAMEAAACGALGLAHRLLKKYDKALAFHTQELRLRRELGDAGGECRTHGHLGAVHMALGGYPLAVQCYREQMERAHAMQDAAVEAQAFGNLGIANLNMGQYEAAIGYLEQQMATLEQVTAATAQHDRARALGHMGDCYDALGDFEEGIRCHERHLQLATGLHSHRGQERAYRGLGHSHRAVGNLPEALVALEKRLVVAHELGSAEAKAAAYGDLGYVHSALGNHEQAVKCLEHQRDIANELGDRMAGSDATSGLGAVFLKMGDLEGALKLHLMDAQLCAGLGVHALQARACGNLGLVYEALRNYPESVQYFEKQLALTSDRLVQANACAALGRVFHTMEDWPQAVNFLRQGLAIAQSLSQSEVEARTRHRLGLVLIASGDIENARTQLEIAAETLETVRCEQRTPETRSSLFELQTTCYRTLQRTLVSMNRTEEALVAAERCKARTAGQTKKTLACSEHIFDIVNRCKQDVLYFSLADDELYAWFLQPQKRIVRFHMAKIDESTLVMPTKGGSAAAAATGSTTEVPLLERFVHMVRDSLGVNSEQVLQEGDGSAWRSSSENLLDDFTNERQGFLRMVNRNHLLNSSNYSLSSLFSLGSVGGSVASLQGSTRSVGSVHGSQRSRRVLQTAPWQGPSSLHALYDLLLKPFDDLLPSSATASRVGHKELILVLDTELYLVPFAVLRSGQDGGEYLSERCSILTVPSLHALRQKSRQKVHTAAPDHPLHSALVVGGPRIPSTLTESWGWSETPAALQEAAMVADMLQTKAIVSTNATKEAVLSELAAAECVHFAANLSWQQAAIVLSPGEMLDLSGNSGNSGVDVPPLSDFMLGPADVLAMPRLNAKLVVLSSYHSLEPISGAGVAVLADSWLRAGAGAILISLWPVPETAAKILMRAFYSALLQGTRAARALAEAMQTVQHTKHFAHPANWAGFLLIGGDVRLSHKVALIGQALCELMRTPQKCHDALRVCLHLVEKSLQRIHRGQKNAMYTTQKSIDNKAGSCSGWKDLLMAVGFRFEPAANGIPSSVFFPQTDPDGRLSQCSASLQALLGLLPTSLNALAKIVSNPEIADDIIAVIRAVVAQFPPKSSGSGGSTITNSTNSTTATDPDASATAVEIPLSVRLWRVSGCHELLASLGFDLMEVGQDQVTLRTSKLTNRRNCQFVLQALLALFDTHEAPKSLGLDSCSSSMESLNEDAVTGETIVNHAEQPLIVTPTTTTMSKSAAIAAPSPAVIVAPPPQRSVSPVQLLSTSTAGKNLTQFRPPLPFRQGNNLLIGAGNSSGIGSGGAFTSYVRRRGEPDGSRAAAADDAAQLSSSHTNTTTDSELSSDGYPTNGGAANAGRSNPANASTSTGANKFDSMPPPPRIGFPISRRAPVKVGRPGGGGESDAAFTPSPPVHHHHHMDSNVSMALAHQTRIRHLYSAAPGMPGSSGETMTGSAGRRPDSSSSASSTTTTDWEGSGHATVLRRANQQTQSSGIPPLPPPRQTMPLVDSLRPLATVYKALGVKQQQQQQQLQHSSGAGSAKPAVVVGLESTSSDSDFDRDATGARGRRLHNMIAAKSTPSAAASGKKSTAGRTNPATTTSDHHHHQHHHHHGIDFGPNNLYFSPADPTDPMHGIGKPGTGIGGGKDAKARSGHNKTVQDSIMRHMNRELTPTISEVYHERSLGLGLAPPLSKLLLSQSYAEAAETVRGTAADDDAATSSLVNDLDINKTTDGLMMSTMNSNGNNNCTLCHASADMMCGCRTGTTKKKATTTTGKQLQQQPWLSNVTETTVATNKKVNNNNRDNNRSGSGGVVTAIDAGTVPLSEYIEAELSAGAGQMHVRAHSPFADLSQRNDGDGRSVADSQYSGIYSNSAGSKVTKS